jgi:hypothetical protein
MQGEPVDERKRGGAFNLELSFWFFAAMTSGPTLTFSVRNELGFIG